MLVIGADTYSTILNPEDRNTTPIFGDGAGAVVLRAGTAGEIGALGPFDLGSDGTLADLIAIPAGGSRQRSSPDPVPDGDQYFHMQGRKVFKNAVLRMADSARKVLARAGWELSDVDHLVAHQANSRILEELAEQLGLRPTGWCPTSPTWATPRLRPSRWRWWMRPRRRGARVSGCC